MCGHSLTQLWSAHAHVPRLFLLPNRRMRTPTCATSSRVATAPCARGRAQLLGITDLPSSTTSAPNRSPTAPAHPPANNGSPRRRTIPVPGVEILIAQPVDDRQLHPRQRLKRVAAVAHVDLHAANCLRCRCQSSDVVAQRLHQHMPGVALKGLVIEPAVFQLAKGDPWSGGRSAICRDQIIQK